MIYKIGSTCFGQSFAHLQERKTEIFTAYGIVTVLTQLDLRGNISTRLRQLMAYADDILILVRTKKSLTEALKQLKKSSTEVGLKINEVETKYLKCSKKDTKKIDLNWQNLSIEQVHQYIYLRSIINDNSK